MVYQFIWKIPEASRILLVTISSARLGDGAPLFAFDLRLSHGVADGLSSAGFPLDLNGKAVLLPK